MGIGMGVPHSRILHAPRTTQHLHTAHTCAHDGHAATAHTCTHDGHAASPGGILPGVCGFGGASLERLCHLRRPLLQRQTAVRGGERQLQTRCSRGGVADLNMSALFFKCVCLPLNHFLLPNSMLDDAEGLLLGMAALRLGTLRVPTPEVLSALKARLVA